MVHGVIGAIYLTGSSTIVPISAHCIYALAFNIMTTALISQCFSIVYSTITMESMMHLVRLPIWTATSYVVCCTVILFSAIIADIFASIFDLSWFKTIDACILAIVELFLATTAAISYWSIDTQITATITYNQTSGVVVIGAKLGGDTALMGQRQTLRMNASML